MRISIESIFLKLFSLYIILKPLYVFNNVPFQPADILLIFNLGLLVLYKINKETNSVFINAKKVLSLYVFIIIYQGLINIFAYLLVSSNTIESISLLRNNLYYLFNALVMYYIFRLYQISGEKLFDSFVIGSFYSMIVVLVGLVASFGRTSRNMSFFDNPNQLGYYALIMLTSVVLLRNYYGNIKRIVVIVISLLSLLVSGSKAAVIGSGILVGFIGLKNVVLKFKSGESKEILIKNLLPIVLIGLVFAFNYHAIMNLLSPYINSFYNRLGAVNLSTFSLGDSRGYSRIGELGIKVGFGVGEGAFFRFTVMTGNETHSSFATILVSYGIVGAFLYLCLFWRTICRKMSLIISYICIFSGILFYWVSHNGLRNSIFWILIMFFVFMNSTLRDESELIL